MTAHHRERLAAWVLGALVVGQLWVLWRSYAYPWLGRIWHYRNEPAFARSLVLGEGYYFSSDEDDLRLVEFLRENVPEDAMLVLPPGTGKFAERNFMQYFMYPRSIDSCSREWSFDQCYRFMIHESGYLLRRGFPELEEVAGRMQYIPWDGRRGLLVPLVEGNG